MKPIPRIIHQLYFPDEAAAPSSYREYRKGVLASHPDWCHRFWTERSARGLLREHYPAFLPVFDAYRFRIQRCDAIRYFLLHRFGGFYVDMDIEFVRPLDTLLGDHQLIFCDRNCIGNAIMGSVPGHPLWPEVFAAMRRRRERPPPRPGRLLDWTQMYYVSRSTGSEMLEDCVVRLGCRDDGTALVVPGHVLEGDARYQVGRDRKPLPGHEDMYAIHHKGMRGVPLRLRVMNRAAAWTVRHAQTLRARFSGKEGKKC
ncbi:glycosyltransferase family 32 protein [Amycolatopsis rubida]|uniref:Glycosyltransferase sugar-binding region containing DXD motif-containing protein n=1 Tax=Amycolatopsis rubida TaxID=112413 RepID=A0A1I6AK43_9PSEU|nr:glycosyltransferase [Amycolatopsis rubida]SFQ68867.1 Glycosyltransferase sugar-binding region containing DXD motif-containing protein [Amycolatopsis rubida]